MKKIALCSLIMCCGFVSYGFADNESCNMSNRTCAYINVGGGYEQNKCLDFYYPKNTLWLGDCCVNDNKVWLNEGTCDPSHAPAGSGHCIEQGTYTNKWCEEGEYEASGTNDGTPCTCNGDATIKEKAYTIRSCAAKYCNDGYLLYTTLYKSNGRDRREEIPITAATVDVLKDYMVGKKVGSQGLCRKKSDLESICQKSCVCPDGEECVLNEVTVTNYNRAVPAFVGEEMCKCVAKDGGNGGTGGGGATTVQPTTEGDCKLTIDVSVMCDNGKKYVNHEEFSISREEIKNLTCEEFNNMIEQKTSSGKKVLNITEFLKQQTQQYEAMEAFINKVCANSGRVQYVPSGNGSDVVAAEKTLTDFFKYADENKSVWKDAEGNFNTARLASDLTAGVVLGTVGGVVSGVVIKKKQVEKGFDALHCTVGGQTVADWGDTFTVGLR